MGLFIPVRNHGVSLVALAVLGTLAGCGGGSSGGDDGSLSLSDTPDYLQRGETAEVSINKSRDSALAIDISELELDLSINTGNCNPSDPLCELWSVTPDTDALSAGYTIPLDFLDSIRSGARYSIDFSVLPAASTPAAVSFSLGATTDAVVTEDGRVWGLGRTSGLPSPGLQVYGYDDHINQPFPTTLSNVREVVFIDRPNGVFGSLYSDNGNFFVLSDDGTASYYAKLNGSSSFSRLPLVDEADQPVTNVRAIIPDFVLLDVGILFHRISEVVGDRAFDPDNSLGLPGLPGNVVQAVGKTPEEIDNFGRLYLTRHSDGTVWQWGRRDDPDSGFRPSYGYPVPTVLSNISQVDVGYARWTSSDERNNYGAALRDDGSVWIWLPYDDTSLPEAQPHQVPGLSNIVEIAAHGPVILGRTTGGDVWQVVIDSVTGGNFIYSQSATRVPWISGARAIAVREDHAMAMLDDCATGGTLRSWALRPYVSTGSASVLRTIAAGDGVRHEFAVSRDAFQPSPVVGIGDADASCQRRVLFYKSGNTKGGDVYVTSDTGNMVCDNYLCWESVNAATANLAIQLHSRIAGVEVTPHWDCEGQGNSFTLSIGADDVYCKLTTSALRLSVNQRTTFNVTETSRSFRYDAIGHTVASVPAGLLTLPGDQAEAQALLPAGTSLQLEATAAPGYTFTGWDGDDCGSDGSVTLSDRNIECRALFIESSVPTGGDYTLTLTLEGGPGAGEVFSLPTPPELQCINSAEPTTVCTHSFAAGTSVNLVGNAFGGLTLSWTGCDMANTDGCFLTMDSDRQVTASFSP